MKSALRFSSGLTLAIALAACSGSTTSTEGTSVPAPASQAAAPAGMTVAPVAPQVTGHARAVADALSQVPLASDQRAEIEKLAADAQARHAAVATAHAQVASLLAAQIESGSLDRAALQPAIDASVAAALASRPADRAAMERLHALLSPDQRGQFVDAIEAEHKSHARGSRAARMEEWAADLKLTDAQRAQIAVVLKGLHSAHHDDFRAAHASGKGLIESFRGDALAPPDPGLEAELRARANARADHLVAVATQVLPLLTAPQRGLAAAKIRAHAESLEAIGGPAPE